GVKLQTAPALPAPVRAPVCATGRLRRQTAGRARPLCAGAGSDELGSRRRGPQPSDALDRLSRSRLPRRLVSSAQSRQLRHDGARDGGGVFHWPVRRACHRLLIGGSRVYRQTVVPLSAASPDQISDAPEEGHLGAQPPWEVSSRLAIVRLDSGGSNVGP